MFLITLSAIGKADGLLRSDIDRGWQHLLTGQDAQRKEEDAGIRRALAADYPTTLRYVKRLYETWSEQILSGREANAAKAAIQLRNYIQLKAVNFEISPEKLVLDSFNTNRGNELWVNIDREAARSERILNELQADQARRQRGMVCSVTGSGRTYSGMINDNATITCTPD
jgi:hypothetical protein